MSNKFTEEMLKSAQVKAKPKAQNLTDNVDVKKMDDIMKGIREKVQRTEKSSK
ncbi:MAG: hypothetical protein WC755_00210 [Candidatus Woesearchaeota archaeon]|jgi:hypothetical protein